MPVLTETDRRQIYRRTSRPWFAEKGKRLGKTGASLGALGAVVNQVAQYASRVTDFDEEFAQRFGRVEVWPEPGVAAVATAVTGAALWFLARRAENGAVTRALAKKYLEQQRGSANP